MLLELLDEQRRCTLLGWINRELIAQVHAFDLRPWGIPPKARIGLLLQPGLSSAVGLISALTWHCVVPLSPTGTAETTAAQLKACGCTCLVASDSTTAIAAAAAALANVPLITLRARGDQAPEGAFAMQPPTPTGGGTPRTMACAMRREDAVLILLTSGTTGQSKRVVYPLRRLVDAGRMIAESLALTAEDVALNFMPLYHVGGITCNFLAPLTSGSRLRCLPSFDAESFFSAANDKQAPATWCYAVPAMWRKVLEYADGRFRKPAAPSLRIARSAGGPLSHADALRLAALFGPKVTVLPTYAMTECMPVCSPPLAYRLERPGSIGLPIVPLRIVDERGAALPPGQVGEIAILRTGEQGQLFDGYEDDERRLVPKLLTTPASWSSKREQVFMTGDRGYLDADGWLFHVGRSKEMVNRGGETIPTAEIEDALSSHPSIAEVMAFAAPHADLGEVVAVALRSDASLDAHELRKWAAGKLTNAQLPHIVVLVSELPRTAKGSLRRVGYAEAIELPGVSGGEIVTYSLDPTLPVGRQLQVVERKGEFKDDEDTQPADSLSRIVHAAGGGSQPPEYVMMSHLYALSMFFVVLHHVVWEDLWQPALPRLVFLVHTVTRPIAVQTFTFLGGLQDRRYPPATVRGALRKLGLNVLLGVLPNVLLRLVCGGWWNGATCARPRVELTAPAIRTLTLGCYPHTHLGLLLRRWIILNLAAYRTVSFPLLLLERRLKLQGVATAIAMLPAIAICIMAPPHCTRVSHLITPCRSKTAPC